MFGPDETFFTFSAMGGLVGVQLLCLLLFWMLACSEKAPTQEPLFFAFYLPEQKADIRVLHFDFRDLVRFFLLRRNIVFFYFFLRCVVSPTPPLFPPLFFLCPPWPERRHERFLFSASRRLFLYHAFEILMSACLPAVMCAVYEQDTEAHGP